MDELVKDIINAQYGGVRARYEAHLKSLDYTPAEAKERLKRETIVHEYLRERFKPMLHEPTRRELVNYYQEHLADVTTTEKAELFLIEVPIQSELKKPLDQATPEEVEAARTTAHDKIRLARAEIDKGADFGAVAKKYSRGPSAAQGGAWGEISPGSLTKRWAKPGEVVFTLKPQEMKEVETPEAFFLVRCGKKTPAQQTSFEEAQKVMMDKVVDEQFSRLRGDYIRDLMKNATITKRNEFTQALLAVVPRPAHPEPQNSMLKSE